NALTYVVTTYFLLVGGIFAFKRSTEGIIPPDPSRVTPAYKLRDGIDYEPLDTPVALGHYFMSIAGASPIIAAVLGMIWGWLPATVYLILAVTFLGTPNEYMHLLISMRNEAKSLGEVVQKKIGQLSGTYLSVILLFVSCLTYAVMMATMAATMASIPTTGLPTLLLIPIAMGFGYLRRVLKMNLAIATVIALAAWGISIWLGIAYPIKLSVQGWGISLGIYVCAASFLPVWLLLAPRDYLNSFILIVGLFLGSLALIVGGPKFVFPTFTSWTSPIRGSLYPAIIATIGCGAINGMHAIISMGTTPKQVKSEKDAYWIVSIGTRGETVIALLSIALVAAFYDYGGYGAEVVKNPGPVFSKSLGAALTYLGFSSGVGATIGGLTLTGFVITTIDSYVRAGRLVLGELTSRSNTIRWMGIPVVGSILVTGTGILLMLYAPFGQLWSGFSLIAIQLTMYGYILVYLTRLEEGKPLDSHFYRWVAVPGIFLVVTTITGLGYFLVRYMSVGQWIPCVIIVILYAITILTLAQVYRRVCTLRASKKPTAETVEHPTAI
ncbi:MAG TPA: carbon starvation protein A, partial [Clostridia bacterium]|nr:carbon starvation protein A [Clostridia bacterium]